MAEAAQIRARKRGRPSLYSDVLAEGICALLAEGVPLDAMCREPGMPAASTVRRWVRQRPAFAAAYQRARDFGADVLVDRMWGLASSVIRAADRGGSMAEGMARFDEVERLHRAWVTRYRAPVLAGTVTLIRPSGAV